MQRREFHRLVAASFFASGINSTPLFAAAAPVQELRWNCRVVRFQPEPDLDSPPVITDITVQTDGDLLALVGDDHVVRLCSKQSGELLKKLHGHEDWVRCAEFSPDGSRLLSAGNDRVILEWDPSTGTLKREFGRQTGAVISMAFNRAGTKLATAGFHDKVTLYDVESSRVLGEYRAPDEDMRSVCFSPDGDLLAAAGRSGVIRIWETGSGAILRDIEAHKRRIHRIQFSDDARSIISCAEDRTVKVTPIDGEDSVTLPRRPCKVQSISLVGGNLIASAGSDNMIRLWNRTSQEEVGQLIGHRGTITSLAFDGNALYSGSYDTELRIWTLSSEAAIR